LPSTRRAGVVALGGVTAVLVGAVAAAPFLPFVDLPQHVAAARLLWNLNRPELARLYEADLLPQVNILALVVGAPLHAMLPEAVAVRLLVGLGIVGLAGALWRLTRSAGVSAWAAVAAMPFALHFDWMYGFLSFGLGIPILLLLCARWADTLGVTPLDDAEASLDWPVWITDAVLWMLLVFAHALLGAFGALGFGLYFVMPGDRRSRLWRATAALPAVLWSVTWLVHTRAVVERLEPGGAWGGIEAFWQGPGTKLAGFGRALVVASTDGHVEWMALAALVLVAIVTLTLGRARDDVPRREAQRFLRGLAFLALLAYLLLPYSLYPRERVSYGLFILYPRFLVLAPLFFLPTLRWPNRRRIAAGLAVLVVGANLAIAARDFTLFSRAGRDAAGLDAAIAAIPPGRIVKSLIFTPFPEGFRYEGFLHVASYYQARSLGETDQSFALLPTSPVHYRDPQQPYLSRRDEHLRPDLFDWQHSDIYDYVLIYDRGGLWSEAIAKSGRPQVYARNGWVVLGPR
jgi:hypothetical protein